MVAVVLCLAMLGILAGPALAQGAGLGAVKLELHERTGVEGWDDEGLGDLVGWAIANTNADGELIVQTHLDDGLADQTFDVFIKVNGNWLWPDVVQLTTNRQGKGNAHTNLNIAAYPPPTDPINVQVIVRKVGADLTLKAGYATATALVPLKK